METCPRAAGYCSARVGTPGRHRKKRSTLTRPVRIAPGLSVDCTRWVAEESPVIGIGVETVGTDAGGAHSFNPAFPCHPYLMGRDKYGLTQLQNLPSLPTTGAMVLAAPLAIVGGSGSPARVLALVEH